MEGEQEEKDERQRTADSEGQEKKERGEAE